MLVNCEVVDVCIYPGKHLVQGLGVLMRLHAHAGLTTSLLLGRTDAFTRQAKRISRAKISSPLLRPIKPL